MSEYNTFADFGLSPETLQALAAKGFETPSPIQKLAIPPLLNNQYDIIAQAQTGTGKTAAYGIPIIEHLRGLSKKEKQSAPRALILAPTRELAMQIETEMISLSGGKTLRHAVLYGGQNIEIQLAKLKHGTDVAIGTPGRILDLIRRGALRLDKIRFAVMDEADEMLDMGFIEDIESILEETPEEKRMLMFSATMPEEIRRIAEQFMQAPEYVSTQTARVAVEQIRQTACEVKRDDKPLALERILAAAEDPYAMVFCRTRLDVDELTMKFQKKGYPVEALHGDLAQAQRTRIISRFKSKQFKVLIATDVAARGIDVNDLTHVINYSLPQSPDIYIHRVGRTGRAGREGIAITLTTPGERRKFEIIRKETGGFIQMEKIPAADAVVKMKKERFLNDLMDFPVEDIPESCRAFAKELLMQAWDPAEVVARILTMKFGTELEADKYPDVFGKDAKKRLSRKKIEIRFAMGKKHGMTPSRLMKFLAEKTKVWRSKIGKITILESESIVELPGDSAMMALEGLRKIHVDAEFVS